MAHPDVALPPTTAMCFSTQNGVEACYVTCVAAHVLARLG